MFTMLSPSASSKFVEGISKCLSILSQLGEVIPTDVTRNVYAEEIAQVKLLLHGKSRQELLSLPLMSNMHKLVSSLIVVTKLIRSASYFSNLLFFNLLLLGGNAIHEPCPYDDIYREAAFESNYRPPNGQDVD